MDKFLLSSVRDNLAKKRKQDEIISRWCITHAWSARFSFPRGWMMSYCAIVPLELDDFILDTRPEPHYPNPIEHRQDTILGDTRMGRYHLVHMMDCLTDAICM